MLGIQSPLDSFLFSNWAAEGCIHAIIPHFYGKTTTNELDLPLSNPQLPKAFCNRSIYNHIYDSSPSSPEVKIPLKRRADAIASSSSELCYSPMQILSWVHNTFYSGNTTEVIWMANLMSWWEMLSPANSFLVLDIIWFSLGIYFVLSVWP